MNSKGEITDDCVIQLAQKHTRRHATRKRHLRLAHVRCSQRANSPTSSANHNTQFCRACTTGFSALSALFNQVAQPNSERNGNTVQLHDADIPYSSLYPGYERPMQSSTFRKLFLR